MVGKFRLDCFIFLSLLMFCWVNEAKATEYFLYETSENDGSISFMNQAGKPIDAYHFMQLVSGSRVIITGQAEVILLGSDDSEIVINSTNSPYVIPNAVTKNSSVTSNLVQWLSSWYGANRDEVKKTAAMVSRGGLGPIEVIGMHADRNNLLIGSENLTISFSGEAVGELVLEFAGTPIGRWDVAGAQDHTLAHSPLAAGNYSLIWRTQFAQQDFTTQFPIHVVPLDKLPLRGRELLVNSSQSKTVDYLLSAILLEHPHWRFQALQHGFKYDDNILITATLFGHVSLPNMPE